jgi:hypothetical protein
MAVRSMLVLVSFALAGCGSETSLAHRAQTDTFLQTPNDEVDILFVMDDSNSMAEEQAELAAGFQGFIDEVEEANSKFRIGVVSTSQDTTDPLRGQLIGDPPYLTAEDDYVREFRERIAVGTGGSDLEQGLLAAALAVQPELLAGANAGFLRDGAQLLVAFVSDEEDCSHNGSLDGFESTNCYTHPEMLMPVEEILDYLWEAKGGDRDLVTFGAIIGPGLEGQCETAYRGPRYARTVQLAGGMIGDICSSDWSTMLTDLGLTAAGVLRAFDLTYSAIPDTVLVQVEGVVVDEDPVNGWTCEGASLEFHGTSVPPHGAEIVVEYEILSGSG